MAQPFYDHEIDAHPDGDRIKATLESILEPLEADHAHDRETDAREADEALEEAVKEKEAELLARAETAEENATAADEEASRLRALLVELSTAILHASKERLGEALQEIGEFLVTDEGWSRVDAAELEGAAEGLTA